jgi:hypothetical protein
MDYRKASIALGFVIAFLAGCLAREVDWSQPIPPARAGASPQRWEYLCDLAPRGLNAVQELGNAAGGKGWEMVGFQGEGERVREVCFKRALP